MTPCLFPSSRLPRAWVRCVAWLLWYANASPPLFHKKEFYELKARLLKRYGISDGVDWQHIRKECWDCDGTGEDLTMNGKQVCCDCRKCRGKGVYREFWVPLTRWAIADRVFHIPGERQSIKPDIEVAIKGYIDHKSRGHASNEAALWLALLFDRRMFRDMMRRAGWCCGWYWYPLCNLQRALATIRVKFKRTRCPCGHKFFFGRGWLVCPKCRKTSAADVPF